MLRVLVLAMALFAFTVTAEVVLENSVVEAQRGGRGGGAGGYKGGGKGGPGGYAGKGAKGPSEEEIAKLKKDHPEDWEEKLKELQDKYAKKGGKNDVKIDTIPDWRQQRASTWVEATDGSLPIVLAFVEKADELNTKYLVHKDAADLSREGALFVWILEGQVQIVTKENDQADKIKAFGEKEEKDLTEEEKAKRETNAKIIARSRLAQSNLWEAYDVKKGGTFLVCDQFGNEFKRYTSKPSGSTIVSQVKKVEADVKKADEAAAKVLTEAKELKEKGKVLDAVKKAAGGLSDGHVGIENVDALSTFLEEILVTIDKDLEEAVTAKNDAKLKDLAKDYANTRIAKAATEAIAKNSAK